MNANEQIWSFCTVLSVYFLTLGTSDNIPVMDALANKCASLAASFIHPYVKSVPTMLLNKNQSIIPN